jgi:hypothetical protein
MVWEDDGRWEVLLIDTISFFLSFLTAKPIDAFADGALVLVCGGTLFCKHDEFV